MAILKKINGGYYNNHVICPQFWYDLLYSWPSIHKFSWKYSHVYQSYSNFEFSAVAILKIQNGGRYSSQITCLHFLYDFNNKKLLIHKISCFYDNLNTLATNRSTMKGFLPADVYGCWCIFFRMDEIPPTTCTIYQLSCIYIYQSKQGKCT